MAEKHYPIRVILLQKFLHVILRKTLLKKGSSSNSFPKTFEFKVFGKGVRGKNLSSERFSPDNYI